MSICCFAGHSNYYFDESQKQHLKYLIEKLINENNLKEFWVGNYGGFDSISARIVCDLKNKYNDIKLCLVIPYLTKKITDYRELYTKFDEIIMADIPQNTPKRFYIVKCNEYMINKSDYLIAFVNHGWGGAALTYKYAKKNKSIKVYNIGSY